ncbi:MAG TPA: hypothetical protein PLN60_07935, partial [Bacillota bacterium]|nr:hypothetical protein [Bacillota bacterium]
MIPASSLRGDPISAFSTPLFLSSTQYKIFRFRLSFLKGAVNLQERAFASLRMTKKFMKATVLASI